MASIAGEMPASQIVCHCCGNASYCPCQECEACNSPAPSLCTTCEHCEGCCGCMHCSACNTACENICPCCDECESCCDCEHCGSCLDPCRRTCPCCNCCEDCCECVHCANCGDAHESLCENCDRCAACCECHRNVIFCERDIQFWGSIKFETNPSHRHIAAELEIAEADSFSEINSVCQKWSVSVVEDGSLPCGTGFELNTSPAQGDAWSKQIREVCQALENDGAKTDRSCGYHIHVDATDYDFAAMQRLIEVYARIEDALFEIVAPWRRNNSYCRRCGQVFLKNATNGHNLEEKYIKAAYGLWAIKADMEDAKCHKHHEARYAALNLHSWNYRGTIECRLHQGVVSSRQIINWGILWAAIIDFAKKHGASKLPAGSMDALLAIAPTTDVETWIISRHQHFQGVK